MNRLTRLLTSAACLMGAALAIACADHATGPGADSFALLETAPTTNLTRCEPQPLSTTSARVGPGGGVLRAGRHTLRIPAGALKKPVFITMQVPSDTLNYVVFSPDGLMFEAAHLPTLAMSYRNCPGAVRDKYPPEIVYVDESLSNVLETTQFVVADTLNNSVHARLRHFSTYVLRKSRYAVAY